MIKLIVRITLAVLIFVAAAFLTLPWWAGSVAQFYLEDWKIKRFELAYPGWHGFEIVQLDLESADAEIQVKNFSANRQLNQIKIGQIEVKLISQTRTSRTETDALTPLNFPKIDLTDLTAGLPVISGRVDSLSIITDSQPQKAAPLLINELNFSLDQNQLLFADFSLSHDDFLKRPTKLELKLQFDSVNPGVTLTSENGPMLWSNYSLENGEKTLSIEVDLKNLANLPLLALADQQINLQGKLKLNASQANAESAIDFSLIVNADFTLPARPDSPLSLEVNSQSKLATLPFIFDTRVSSAGLVNFSGDSTFSGSLSNVEIEGQLVFDGKFLSAQALQINAHGPQLQLPAYGLGLDDIKVKGKAGQFRFWPQQSYPERFSVEVVEGELTAKQDEKVKLQAQLSAQLDYHAEVQPDEPKLLFSLQAAEVDYAGLYYSPLVRIDAELTHFDLSPQSARATLKFSDADGQLGDIFYRQLGADLKVRRDKDQLIAEGDIRLNSKMLTPLQLAFDRSSGETKIELASQQANQYLLNQILTQLESEQVPSLALQSGSLEHSATLSYKDKLSARAKLDLNNATLKIGETLLNDADVTVNVEAIQPLRATALIKLKQIQLADSFNINDLSAEISSQSLQSFLVTDLSLRAFSGQVNSDKLSVRQSQLQPSLVQVKHLSLKQLIDYLEMENITLTGDIDMTVPVSTQEDAVIIRNATFSNVTNGVIQYTSEQAQAVSDNIALQALRNLHYSQLSGSINHLRGNQHRITLRVIGKNPDLQDGRPIDLTLNLDIDFSELLSSLLGRKLGA